MKTIKLIKYFLFVLILNSSFIILNSSALALEVDRTVLPNGLTLLIVERHTLPVVKVSVGIKAGNICETAGMSGLANLTAGLLTSGTKTRTAHQISEEIEFVGGGVGASGGSDFVTASLSVLKKDIDIGFDLLADIIMNPSFPDDEVAKKKERIKGSLRSMEDEPGYLASRAFKQAVFGPEHPYGRQTSGTADSIDKIIINDIRTFHSQYYVPNNSTMAVVGDITTEEVKELIDKYFSGWKAGDVPALSLPEIKPLNESRLITIDRDLTQANIILGHIGVKREDPDYYAISVMNYILGGGGFASRLMQNIREEKGLAYDVHSYFAPAKYAGRFQAGLQTKNESANTAVRAVLDEMKAIMNVPVSDIELADAKSFLTGSFPMKIETGSRIAGFLIAVEFYGLGAEYIDNYPDYINRVSKNDIMRVAKKYLHPDNFVLVAVADLEKAVIDKAIVK